MNSGTDAGLLGGLAAFGSALAGLGLIAAAIAIYFVPAIVAHRRDHHNRMAITVLTFLLGWTIIGWAGALVWACTEVHD